MARTSQRDLSEMAAHIESITGIPVMIGWAYGAPRLESADGSREISPRLPSGQLMDWMRAFLAGYDAATRPDSPTWGAMRRFRRNAGDESADYGWIITVDKVFDPEFDKYDDKGTAGPRNIPDAIYKRLKKGEGQAFKMYDDDGNHYYSGRYIGPDDETMFAPLNDFGTPNAGAVRIDYKNAAGKWEAI